MILCVVLKLNHFVREHSFFVTMIYFRLCRLYVTPFKLCEARFCKDRRAWIHVSCFVKFESFFVRYLLKLYYF